eukprot:6179991-Amphidinium_carterae.1
MAGRTGEIGVTSDVDLLWNPADVVVAGRSGELGPGLHWNASHAAFLSGNDHYRQKWHLKCPKT